MNEATPALLPDWAADIAPEVLTLPIMRRLDHYGERYYYRLIKERTNRNDINHTVKAYNSVTSYLSKVEGDKGGLINWAADLGSEYRSELMKRAAYGTLLHSFLPHIVTTGFDLSEPRSVARHVEGVVEKLDYEEGRYLIAELLSGRLTRKLEADVFAIAYALSEMKFQPILCEAILYSDTMELAGAADLVGYVDFGQGAELVIIDLKSGCRDGVFYNAYGAQLELYAQIYEELTGHTVNHIINLSPKDIKSNSRKFYNVHIWDREVLKPVISSYATIWDKLYRADNEPTKMLSAKSQSFAGIADVRNGAERTVDTKLSRLVALHAADFAQMPNPEPVIEHLTDSEEQSLEAFVDAHKPEQPQAGNEDGTVRQIAYGWVLDLKEQAEPYVGKKGRPAVEVSVHKAAIVIAADLYKMPVLQGAVDVVKGLYIIHADSKPTKFNKALLAALKDLRQRYVAAGAVDVAVSFKKPEEKPAETEPKPEPEAKQELPSDPLAQKMVKDYTAKIVALEAEEQTEETANTIAKFKAARDNWLTDEVPF